MLASDRARLVHTLRDAPIASAYLFGSHARGTAHAQSDLDIAILFDTRTVSHPKARQTAADALRLDLMAALGQNQVDVVVLNDASPELAVSVIHTGEPLERRDAEADHVFQRDAQLRYADLRPFLDRTRRLKADALAP
jgi:predicted nucleotidyltransferase